MARANVMGLGYGTNNSAGYYTLENSRLVGLVSCHYTFWQRSNKHSSHTHNHITAVTLRNAFLEIDSSTLCTPFSQKALNFSTHSTKLANAFCLPFQTSFVRGKSWAEGGFALNSVEDTSLSSFESGSL
jgi:hypothetical protein